MAKPKFFTPEPKMPTPEEHRTASLSWLRRVQPTLIDQWPADLAALSMPTTMVKIDVPAVWDGLCAGHDGKGIAAPLVALAAELDAAMGWNRKFVRLNSRSPKDAIWPFEVPATLSGKEAVSMLTGSMRVMDDLLEFRYVPEQPAYVCLRDWVYGFNTADEYRGFVKDRKLIAVTHYDYIHPWAGPADGGKALRSEIEQWFTSALLPVLHVDTVVFDIHVGRDSILLIEINPYGLSDPCHFGDYESVENARGYVEFAKPDALAA